MKPDKDFVILPIEEYNRLKEIEKSYHELSEEYIKHLLKEEEMTPTKIRNLIDTLIEECGFDKVKITINSIIDFYEERN